MAVSLSFGSLHDRRCATKQARSTVLIAEDDRAVRESLERAVRLDGYSVTTVADGAAALASIILLSLLGVPRLLEKLSALAFGAGSLTYSIFWMLAGFQAPGLGSTGAAKEALNYVAIPGAGLCIFGLAGTLCAVLVRLKQTTAVSEIEEESVD